MASRSLPRAPAKLDQSSQALLDKLDRLLQGCSTPREVDCAHGEDYTKGLDELKKICASHMRKAEQVVASKACERLRSTKVDSSTDSFTFTMLSVGCGDGTFDAKIIQAIAERFPKVKIRYIGTDIDKEICQKAEQVLGDLTKNVAMDIETLVFDFKDVDDFKDRLPPCDLIMASHVLYYVRDVKKALTDIQSLKKQNGSVFILLTTSQSPRTQLYRRFWRHESGWPMIFPERVVENLDSLSISYDTHLIDGELDLTRSFQERFEKPHQAFLLDFMTHTKMARYPAEIRKTCIDYLALAAVGKPERYTMLFSVAFIVF